MWSYRLSFPVSLLVAAGCSSGGASRDGGVSTCGDIRGVAHIYHGTTAPTYAPLTPGQVLAVGAWTDSGPDDSWCTGTLIAPRFVLTADHCGVNPGNTFCFGEQSRNATCVAVVDVFDGPTVTVGAQQVYLDIAVAELAEDATALVPGLQPILPIVESLAGYPGQMVETAGYGETDTGGSGVRFFAVEVVDAVGPDDDGVEFLRVDGGGERGVCFGDSGGPALVVDSAGQPRVAGTLSWGDPSCVDRDRFTRVDLALPWIEVYTGPTPPPDGSCGSIDQTGRCTAGRALWCDGSMLTSETCGASETCGWDSSAGGFRCISGEDPCQGVDAIGRCDNNVARWCEGGEVRQSDCTCLGQVCGVVPASGGVACADDPCAGIGYLGRCNGDVAEWCEDGAFVTENCASGGRTCGYVNEEVGYYCQ